MSNKQTDPEAFNPDDRSAEALYQRLAGEESTLRMHTIPALEEKLRFASRKPGPDPNRVAHLLGDSSVATLPVTQESERAETQQLSEAKVQLADLQAALPIADNRQREEKQRRTAYHQPAFSERRKARDVELAGLLSQIQGVIADSKADVQESERLGLMLNCRSRDFNDVDTAMKNILLTKREWIRGQTEAK